MVSKKLTAFKKNHFSFVILDLSLKKRRLIQPATSNSWQKRKSKRWADQNIGASETNGTQIIEKTRADEMTFEEMEKILQTVVGNQANHDQALAHLTTEVTRITADIDQIDKGVALLLKSQNRYEENFNRLNGIVSDLADKYVKLEEIMIENAAAHQRYEKNFEQFREYFKTFTQFVIDFSQQSNGKLNKIDERLDRLTESQVKSNGRLDRIESNLDRLTESQVNSNGRLDRIEENIKQLTEAQIKTDEQIRAFVQSSLKPSPAKRARKPSKKKGNK
jgi:chromosome segregation ATPase